MPGAGGRPPFRHPALMEDGAHAAAMKLLRTNGHLARRIYTVDITDIAYVNGQGKPMTAVLRCDDGEHVTLSHVVEGWDIT